MDINDNNEFLNSIMQLFVLYLTSFECDIFRFWNHSSVIESKNRAFQSQILPSSFEAVKLVLIRR